MILGGKRPARRPAPRLERPTGDQLDAAYGVILERDAELFWDEERVDELHTAVAEVLAGWGLTMAYRKAVL